MSSKNPAYVSPWPTLIGLAVILGSSFVDRASAPAWLLWTSSLALGLALSFFLLRAERQHYAKADELERHIRAEGHSFTLHVLLAAALMVAPLQQAGLLHLELRHFCAFLFAVHLVGPWFARRRYR